MMCSERIQVLVQGLGDSPRKISANPQNVTNGWFTNLDSILLHYGLEPAYVWVIIANLVTVIFWKSFKNWNKDPVMFKVYDVVFLCGLGILNLICLLRLIGVID